MFLILWIAFGGIAGWIASIITHTNDRMGIIWNVVVGLIGSALGGWIASLLGLGALNTFSIGGMLIAILGAVILISIVKMIRGKTASKTNYK